MMTLEGGVSYVTAAHGLDDIVEDSDVIRILMPNELDL